MLDWVVLTHLIKCFWPTDLFRALLITPTWIVQEKQLIEIRRVHFSFNSMVNHCCQNAVTECLFSLLFLCRLYSFCFWIGPWVLLIYLFFSVLFLLKSCYAPFDNEALTRIGGMLMLHDLKCTIFVKIKVILY